MQFITQKIKKTDMVTGVEMWHSTLFKIVPLILRNNNGTLGLSVIAIILQM